MSLATSLRLVCSTIIDGGLGVIGRLSSLLAARPFLRCLLLLSGFSLPLGKSVSFTHHECSNLISMPHIRPPERSSLT